MRKYTKQKKNAEQKFSISFHSSLARLFTISLLYCSAVDAISCILYFMFLNIFIFLLFHSACKNNNKKKCFFSRMHLMSNETVTGDVIRLAVIFCNAVFECVYTSGRSMLMCMLVK